VEWFPAVFCCLQKLYPNITFHYHPSLVTYNSVEPTETTCLNNHHFSKGRCHRFFIELCYNHNPDESEKDQVIHCTELPYSRLRKGMKVRGDRVKIRHSYMEGNAALYVDSSTIPNIPIYNMHF